MFRGASTAFPDLPTPPWSGVIRNTGPGDVSLTSGANECEVPCQLLVESQRLADAAEVVEADAVCVVADRPDQHDVVGERAAVICLGRDVDGSHPPAVDRQAGERPDARLWIPSGAVDYLGVVCKRPW